MCPRLLVLALPLEWWRRRFNEQVQARFACLRFPSLRSSAAAQRERQV
jgi:hypothetical protein